MTESEKTKKMKDILTEVAIIVNDISLTTEERIRLIIGTYEANDYKTVMDIEDGAENPLPDFTGGTGSI